MNFWDPLRVLDSFAVAFDLYITPVVFVISLILLAISIRAYQKKPSRRFLLLCVAFGFFAIEWAFKLLDIFFSPGLFFSLAAQDVFELIILFSLFFALFQK
jgi:hypothetical protein